MLTTVKGKESDIAYTGVWMMCMSSGHTEKTFILCYVAPIHILASELLIFLAHKEASAVTITFFIAVCTTNSSEMYIFD